MRLFTSFNCTSMQLLVSIRIRDGGLEDRPWSRGGPRDLILMVSVSVLVSAAHVSVSVSEVPALSAGSRESASRPNLDGLGLSLGLGHPCLGLGLGGPGLDYNPVSYSTCHSGPKQVLTIYGITDCSLQLPTEDSCTN